MNRTLLNSLFCLAGLAVATAQTPTAPQNAPDASFRALQVDAGKVVGTIRSFQGLNGPPYPIMEGLPDLTESYQDLHIDTIRTHDIMGPTDLAARYSTRNPLLAWLVPDLQQRTRLGRRRQRQRYFS